MFEGLYIVEDMYGGTVDIFVYEDNDWLYLTTIPSHEALLLTLIKEYGVVTYLSEKQFTDMGGHW